MSCIYGIEQSCSECGMCQSKEEQTSTETVKERKEDRNRRKYTWSDNQTDEIWHNDRFNTIEECVKDAIKHGKHSGEEIAIGVCEDYVPCIDVDTLLDMANEDAYNEVGEVADGWLEYKIHKGYKDADKLQEKINKVFTEWLEETKQVPSFYHVVPLADMITIPENKECGRMIKEVKLNTLHMFENENTKDEDYPLWQKIAEYINGETALVIESQTKDEEYVFLGLKDEKKNKELFYMMEQDSMIGAFIDDREGFDIAWDSKEYEPDSCFYLEPQYLIFETKEENQNANPAN